MTFCIIEVLPYDTIALSYIACVHSSSVSGIFSNAYESIVRTLLQKNITPVLLFSVTENDHSAQDYMKQIGEFYQCR